MLAFYMLAFFEIHQNYHLVYYHTKQGRKRPLDTPKKMIERRERDRKRERDVRDIERESERERHRERVKGRRKSKEEKILQEISQTEK